MATNVGKCPRCGNVRPLGPWKDSPQWTILCGPCKAHVWWSNPASRRRFATEIKRAFRALAQVLADERVAEERAAAAKKASN